MMPPPIEPFVAPPADRVIASLPKADLHVHAEAGARLDRVLARREGRPPYKWQAWARHLMADVPPGMERLRELGADVAAAEVLDADADNFVARIVDLLDEEGADGAIYVEVRFGRETVLRRDFMALFREAERKARERYPRLRAEALCCVTLLPEIERVEPILAGCLRTAREGLAGVDFIPEPYDAEADWSLAYRWAERLRDAGLGITAHAGEFSPANIRAALCVPGLTRLGHAVYAGGAARLLDEIVQRGITVECCPTCNVVLGAVRGYGAHPLRSLMHHGVAITLNSDDPVRVCTSIGQEYVLAHAMGLNPDELLRCTRNALRASFTKSERRAEMLREVDEWHPTMS